MPASEYSSLPFEPDVHGCGICDLGTGFWDMSVMTVRRAAGTGERSQTKRSRTGLYDTGSGSRLGPPGAPLRVRSSACRVA